MRRLLLALCLSSACGAGGPPPRPDAALPSCAAVGCPERPSGDPKVWTPCTGDTCYCPAGDGGSVACVP